MTLPVLTILSGPNGAGKTTFAHITFHEQILQGQFINADTMAQELDHDNYIFQDTLAARKALSIRESFINDKKDLIIETTLASRGLHSFTKRAKARRFTIHFHYLWITLPALCDFRVKQRVLNGGHNIDFGVILRRYKRSLAYIDDYLTLSDKAYIYFADMTPQLIVCKEDDKLTIKNDELWLKLQAQCCELKNLDSSKNLSAVL